MTGSSTAAANGHGVTRRQSMAYLKTLDIGCGYTADGGKTYPFRGKGVGIMPTLNEVLIAFPGRQFVINMESRDPAEGERLFNYLRTRGYPHGRFGALRSPIFHDRIAQPRRVGLFALRAAPHLRLRSADCATRP
jgi:hypothetical protein